MAKAFGIKCAAVTVGTTAVALGTSGEVAHFLELRAAAANGDNIYIGGPDVTTATGLLLDAGERLQLPSFQFGAAGEEFRMDQVYAVAGAADQVLFVLHDKMYTV